jgi:hypothetical protein
MSDLPSFQLQPVGLGQKKYSIILALYDFISFFGVKGYKDHLGFLEYYKFYVQNPVNLLRKFHNPAPCIYLLVHEYSTLDER